MRRDCFWVPVFQKPLKSLLLLLLLRLIGRDVCLSLLQMLRISCLWLHPHLLFHLWCILTSLHLMWVMCKKKKLWFFFLSRFKCWSLFCSREVVHQFQDPCPCLGKTKSLCELSLLTTTTNNMFLMKQVVVVVCTIFPLFFFAGFMGMMMSVECWYEDWFVRSFVLKELNFLVKVFTPVYFLSCLCVHYQMKSLRFLRKKQKKRSLKKKLCAGFVLMSAKKATRWKWNAVAKVTSGSFMSTVPLSGLAQREPESAMFADKKSETCQWFCFVSLQSINSPLDGNSLSRIHSHKPLGK